MGVIADAINIAFSDGPSSNPDRPDKAAIRRAAVVIEDQVGGAAAGIKRSATVAGLGTGDRMSQPGQVTAGAGKGEYYWSGTAWVRTGDLIDPPLLDAKTAAAYNNSQLSVIRGKIVKSGTTNTVSWTTARATFSGAASAVVQIADVSDLAIASNEVVYIDLAGGSPYVLTKVTTSAALRADFASGAKLMLLHNNAGTLIGPMYTAIFNSLLFDRVSWDANEIVVSVNPALGQIDIWQKASSNPLDSSYLRWRFSHQVEAGNYDVWRINGIFDETRTDRYNFTQLRRIVSPGECETAIQQTGKPDFMGGVLHGDEIVSRSYLLIDGVPQLTDPGGTRYYRCQKVEFIQASTLYEVGTSLSNPVASVLKRWEWKDGEMHLSQRVTWQKVISVNGAYLAMLPIERVQYNDTSFQITTGAQREPNWEPINVSNAGHATADTNAGYIKIFGGVSGYAAEVEVLKGWDKPNRRSTIEDAEIYNKLRFDFTGPGYMTTIGEVWDTKSRYRLMKTVGGAGS